MGERAYRARPVSVLLLPAPSALLPVPHLPVSVLLLPVLSASLADGHDQSDAALPKAVANPVGTPHEETSILLHLILDRAAVAVTGLHLVHHVGEDVHQVISDHTDGSR